MPVRTTSCVSDDSTRIPPVSTEVWEQIFSKLNQKHVAKARLVCPYWRAIIDNNYKFSITIKETSFKKLPVSLKIIKCFIHWMLKDAHKIFQYPYQVETLHLLGSVNLSTLRNILMETTNLKELSFTNIHDGPQTEIYMPEDPIHFKNLRRLKLHHDNWYSDGSDVPNENFVRIFSYKMPFLEKLDIRMMEWFSKLENLLPTFFKFLAKHKRSIKRLQAVFIPKYICFGERAIIARPLSQEKFDKILPENIKEELRDPEFQLKTLIIALPTLYSSLWESIIKYQKKLISFYTECLDTPRSTPFAGLPFQTIQPTLIQNASTLVTLHLAGLSLEDNENLIVDPRRVIPLDGSVFTEFNKLRRLVLRRKKADYVNYHGFQSNEITITNVQSIPLKLLEVFELSGFVCETRELEKLVENAPKLKMVVFLDTGKTDGTGVTVGIIYDLTKRTDIEFIDVSPLKPPCCEKSEEQKKLIQLQEQHPQAFTFEGKFLFSVQDQTLNSDMS